MCASAEEALQHAAVTGSSHHQRHMLNQIHTYRCLVDVKTIKKSVLLLYIHYLNQRRTMGLAVQLSLLLLMYSCVRQSTASYVYNQHHDADGSLSVLFDGESNSGSKKKSLFCHDREYRSFTLKRIREAPFSGLFPDVKNQTKFEGSDVATLNGSYYVVFDSSFSIGKLDDTFAFRGAHNALIGEKGEVDSQFEGIAYVPENDSWLFLAESMEFDASSTGETVLKPHVTHARMRDDDGGYDILAECVIDFELTHENKGFEAIAYVPSNDGTQGVLLGLCEGNYCVGGARGKDSGNGKIVVSTLDSSGDECVWRPQKVIDIPAAANFQDYAGMALHTGMGKIAILSQEDAAVYIADFDVETLSFTSEEGQIFHLPRDNHCSKIYCNVEGIQFLDEYRVVIVSDKSKKYQPYYCDEKDQSVHIFSLPQSWDPYKKNHAVELRR